MTSPELEKIARRAAEIAGRGETFEDDRVELKSAWPDPITEMARQLAAQANASGREEFVWLIGIRQKGGVVGAPARDGAEWLPRLRPTFDEAAVPILSTHLNLDFDGKNVVALAWDLHEPPYVIKSNAGPIYREVPWREGEMVRQAGRRDLLRLLEPIALAPALELVPNGIAWITAHLFEGGGGLQWRIRCLVRVTPRGSKPVVIPYGETTCRLLMEGADKVALKLFMITNDGETQYRITGNGEVTFAAPSTIEVMSDPLPAPSPLIARPDTITAEIEFQAIAQVERQSSRQIGLNQRMGEATGGAGGFQPPRRSSFTATSRNPMASLFANQAFTALLGVVLGAVLGFAGTALLSSKQTKDAHRAAVRAIVVEMAANWAAVELIRRNPGIPRSESAVLDTTAYDALLAPLYSRLPSAIATPVALAYGGMHTFKSRPIMLATEDTNRVYAGLIALMTYATEKLGMEFPPLAELKN